MSAVAFAKAEATSGIVRRESGPGHATGNCVSPKYHYNRGASGGTKMILRFTFPRRASRNTGYLSRPNISICAFAICFLFMSTIQIRAQANDLNVLRTIQEVVQEICQAPNRRGEYVRIEGDGAAGFSIGIRKFVGVAGINANAKFTKEEWDGVRKVLDQNTENANYRDCVTKLTPMFLEKFTKPAKNSRSILREQLPRDIKILGRFVRYTKWLDGSQSCWNGAVCATASLILQNQSDIGFDAAIRHGSTSIGSCLGGEMEAAGLKIYNNNPGWTNNVDFSSASSFVPAAARVPITVKLENCSSSGERNVDVAIAITVVADGHSFDIPLSAFDVPVR